MTIAEVRRRLALATAARANLDAAVAELLPRLSVVRWAGDTYTVSGGVINDWFDVLILSRTGDVLPVPLAKLLDANPELEREPAVDHKYAEARL